MKINIVGAGPAGLYFALLMKEAWPHCDIRIYERSPSQLRTGWGIVWSERTLAEIASTSPVFFASLKPRLATWDDVVVVHRGQTMRFDGHRYFACARTDLIALLTRMCDERAIPIHYAYSQNDLQRLAQEADLLVGADGAHSSVRTLFAKQFVARVDPRPNRFLWLGTRRLFDGLHLIFQETPQGAFCAHAYQFNSEYSTFIVECSDATALHYGVETANPTALLHRLETIFAPVLQGHALLTANSELHWAHFNGVSNQHWHTRNSVLLGDALHTAHFSIGSGTSLAMGSAAVLAECVQQHADLEHALKAFAERRRPAVDKLQASAVASMRWFEQLDDVMPLDPLPLALSCLCRSGRLDEEQVRRRSPKFFESFAP